MRKGMLVLLAAATLLSAAPADANKSKVGWAANAGSAVVSDGVRFASFQLTDGRPVVRDFQRKTTRMIADAKGCVPADISSGRVLLDCSKGWSFDFVPPRIASVWTGKSQPIPGANKSESYDNGAIGKNWVRGDCQAGGPCYWVVYRNFRTGASKTFRNIGTSAKAAPPGLSVYDYDLNQKRLGKFMPHPKFSIFGKRRGWSQYFGFARSYYLVGRSNRVHLVRSPRNWKPIGPTLGGVDRPVEFQQSSGKIFWSSGKQVRGFDLRTRKRFSRSFNGPVSSFAVLREGLLVGESVRGKPVRLKLIRF